MSTPRKAAAQDAKRQRAKKQALAKRREESVARDARLRKNKRRPSVKRPPASTLAMRKEIRERWAAIAEETRQIVMGDGKYVEERDVAALAAPSSHPDQPLGGRSTSPTTTTVSTVRVAHDIFAQIQLSRQGTTFYPHYSKPLAHWAVSPPPPNSTDSSTAIEFMHCSTLTAARRLSTSPSTSNSSAGVSTSASTLTSKVGVLSFASPKKPGGGYLHGGDEQEEVIARLSSLVASLSSPSAQDFYKEHRQSRLEDGSGLHDHSMVYSPGVVVFRADADDSGDAPAVDAVGGAFIPPYTINVLSAVPVNVAAVRTKHVILPSERDFFEDGIRSVTKERMARALRVFEERGDRTLVLGAFGCASSQNSVETIATIWAELLVTGDAADLQTPRFRNAFDRVVFAVPGKHFAKFKEAFEMRVFEAEVAQAALTD